MKDLVQSIAAAVVTFTRIPVGFPLAAERFQDATWHIPLIGWLNAGLVVFVWRYIPLPLDLKYIFIFLLPLIVSGAMHEDGLADAADALFGGQNVEQRLRIMKDPHLGSFGVLSLVIYVLAYFLALKNIPKAMLVPALCIALPLSRLQGPLLSAVLAYARPESEGSKAKAYLGSSSRKIFWSFLWLVPLVYFIPSAAAAWKILGMFLATSLALGALFRQKIGGITGDCLGAAIKVSELALLWSFAAREGLPSAIGSFWESL